MANRFTTMRQNVEAALENSAAIAATGLAVHKWDGQHKALMDDPKITLKAGIRVDPGAINWDPWAMNATTRFTQHLELMCWLPEQKGLKAEEIEEIVLAVCRALVPLRSRTMAVPVEHVEGFTVKGGEVEQANMSRDPKKQPANADFTWSHVCAIEIQHDVPLAELVEA
jgi:hypothetical protein